MATTFTPSSPNGLRDVRPQVGQFLDRVRIAALPEQDHREPLAQQAGERLPLAGQIFQSRCRAARRRLSPGRFWRGHRSTRLSASPAWPARSESHLAARLGRGRLGRQACLAGAALPAPRLLAGGRALTGSAARRAAGWPCAKARASRTIATPSEAAMRGPVLGTASENKTVRSRRSHPLRKNKVGRPTSVESACQLFSFTHRPPRRQRRSCRHPLQS